MKLKRHLNPSGVRRRYLAAVHAPLAEDGPSVAGALLARLSTGDFHPALASLLGKAARGLSAANITRMTSTWEQDYTTLLKRDVSAQDYAYVWVDSVRFHVRLEEDRL